MCSVPVCLMVASLVAPHGPSRGWSEDQVMAHELMLKSFLSILFWLDDQKQAYFTIKVYDRMCNL